MVVMVIIMMMCHQEMTSARILKCSAICPQAFPVKICVVM